MARYCAARWVKQEHRRDANATACCVTQQPQWEDVAAGMRLADRSWLLDVVKAPQPNNGVTFIIEKN